MLKKVAAKASKTRTAGLVRRLRGQTNSDLENDAGGPSSSEPVEDVADVQPDVAPVALDEEPELIMNVACAEPCPQPDGSTLLDNPFAEFDRPLACAQPYEPIPVPDSIFDNMPVSCAQLPPHMLASPPSWWADSIKNNTGLTCPTAEFPSLAKLCVRSILDNDVYVRDAPGVNDEARAAVADGMRRFPFYSLKEPLLDAWSPHVVEALHEPIAAADPATGPQPVINVSVDLVDSANRIYQMALMIDTVDELARQDNVELAMDRYEKFLKLESTNARAGELRSSLRSTSSLEAGPRARHKLVDRRGPLIVLDKFGKLLTDDSDYDVEVALERTRTAWREAYGDEYIVNLAEVYPDGAAHRPGLVSANLLATMTPAEVVRDRKWLAGLHVVTGADGADALAAGYTPFFRGLVRSYERFLFLAAKYPDRRSTFISVAYDADLIWHAHQIFPSLYEQDMGRILGRAMAHVPWPDYTAEQHARNTSELHSVWTDEFPDDPFNH
ncbi:uncharacterized protein AMSG_12212 [Thecamonas trahens ATCC 50062]|uniref:Uncharacterized protein n=1 Tax=Thecamonas trahens ATCC 50062 TaxID=461836 RepID=A0A0L0DM53_THETB|nr:hypothetical protein AMSG_12212 [Thecamonas trahens ATCC 50062]KNC53392.1 hypothetical protein AMSG_12212 [Thecamonas trahens ATCC 50062]|eukprot:XP_013754488.1 hypothetical protein AMSG_12212 [Thecamonas trahens ATCC 50062]